MKLDQSFKAEMRRRIESAIIPAMRGIYRPGQVTFSDDFRPGFKRIEKVVSYHDYAACGISVLAVLASRGDAEAAELVERVLLSVDHYRNAIWRKEVPGYGVWSVPLRRLIFHLALAYEGMAERLSAGERERYRGLVEEQGSAAIAHCRGFLPGVTDLHLAGVNNHTAVFMQGIHYCGRVIGKPEWVELTREFAGRFFDSGHPDGYFEEHTNPAREGGPSLVYTPLTAGCLFDVLAERRHTERFRRAGDFFRGFLDHGYRTMPIADERTNHAGVPVAYGMALHTLTPRGRAMVMDIMQGADFATYSPEALAVLYHELDLMEEGDCETPECRTEGATRIGLPLGVLRRHGFAAGISALRALNRTLAPTSDYALDHQCMLSLSHIDSGAILTGVKSKNDPSYSTFRIGEDAYPVSTGTLEMGSDWAEAELHYASFDASIRWDLGARARLRLGASTDRTVTTSLPISDPGHLVTDRPFEVRTLRGFSPYNAGNADAEVRAAVFEWRRSLSLELAP